MKAVLFTRAHLMYQRGEIAGFPEDHAQKLIAAGIARDPEAPLAEVDPAPDQSEADGRAGAGAADQPDTKPTSAKADPASDPGTKADPDTGAKTDTKPAPGAPPAQGKRR
ncbi:hypothetical protein [Salipiger marinus]|uniref:hypothetical protein n=1 Tax=Salipiger marinus TaxID=555512 RepID=UPI004059EC87